MKKPSLEMATIVLLVLALVLLLWGWIGLHTTAGEGWVSGQIVHRYNEKGQSIVVETSSEHGVYLWYGKGNPWTRRLTVEISEDRNNMAVIDTRPDATFLLQSIGDIAKDCNWRVHTGQIVTKKTSPTGYAVLNAVRKHYLNVEIEVHIT